MPIYLASLSGTSDPDFSLAQMNCPSGAQSIAPFASCTVKLNFAPIIGGNLQYQVTASFGTLPGDTSLTTNVTLTGIGVAQVSFAGLSAINPANVNTTSMPLTWAPAMGASSYTLYQSTDGGATYGIAQVLGAGTTAWTISGLSPNSNYTFKAKAQNALGQVDSNTVTQSATTDTIGSFGALSDLNTAEGSTLISADIGLNCTDAKGHYPSFMSITSISDATAQCVLLNSPYRIQCSPGYKVGASPYSASLAISCLLDGYPTPYSQTMNVNVAFSDRAPVMTAIGNQSVLAGTAISPINPVASSPNLFTLNYFCKYDTLVDGSVSASAANCASLLNQNGTAASFSATNGSFTWTPPLSSSNVSFELKISALDPYGLQASSVFTINVGEPPPDPAQSTITVAQSSLNSGSGTLVTLHAKDSSGNPIPKGGSTVTFNSSTSAGVSTGTFSATTDHNDGTYTAVFTGVLAGTSTSVRAIAQGVTVTSASPGITVNSGPLSLTSSMISVSSSTVISGNTLTATLTSKDAAGNLITTGGKTVVFARSGGTSTGSFSATSDLGNGIYTAVFTGVNSGSATTITANVNGSPITSVLPSVTVNAGALSLAQSSLSISGGATLLASGASLAITLTTRDANNNLINSGGQTVLFSASGGTSTLSIGSVTDNGNGTYSAVITGAQSGSATSLSASIGGLSISSALPSLSVVPGLASLSQSLVSLPVSTLASGASSLVTLTAKDANGNTLTSGGSSVTFTKSVSTIGSISTVTDNGNGTYQATFTGNLVGSALIGATLGGGTVTSALPSVSVTPGALSLSQSIVISSSPSIASGSTANINLVAKDAAGNNLSSGGRTVLFSRSGGTSQGNFSSVSDNSNGTYSAVFTGTTAGTATAISATIDGAGITSVPANVSVIPANLSLSNSSLAVSATSLTAGTSISLILTARDASGNSLSSGGLTVTFARSGGVSNGSFSAVVDHGDGTYTANFSGTAAGSATTLTAMIGGSLITSALPSVTVSQGALSYAQSTVTVSAPSVASGSTATLTLFTKDQNGNLLASGGQTVLFSLSGGTSSGSIGTVTDNSNGTYTAVFTGTTAGSVTSVLATVGGTLVTSTAPHVTVTAAAISYSQSLVTLSTSAILSGSTSTISLTAKDANGNTVSTPGLSVFFAKSGGSSNGTISAVSDLGNGTYTAVFTGTTSGSATAIVAVINGSSVTSASPTLTVSPGSLSLSQSSINVSSVTVVSGGVVNLTLTTKDLNGNVLTGGGQSISFSKSGGTSNGVISSVTDNANGTYTATFTANTSGSAISIGATIGGSAVTSALPSITVNAGNLSLSQSIISVSSASVTSGSTVALTLTAKDASGNTLSTGGATVVFSRFGGSSNGNISATTDNANGTYTAVFTSTTAGTATTINATANGGNLTSVAPSILVNAGSISLAQSLVSVSSSSVSSGNTVTVTLTAKDAGGNPLSTGGASVIFSRVGGSSSGTLNATTDNSNGTYTAIFTATSAGTATTLNATVSGSLVTSVLPTITVNPGTLSLLQSSVTIAGNASFIGSGSAIALKLTTRDSNGNQLTSGGQSVVFTATSGTSTGAFSALTDNLDGTYSVMYTGAATGSANFMSATIGGIALSSASPSLAVVPGTVSYANSSVTVGATSIQAGSTSLLTLTIRDSNGNILNAGGQSVSFNFTSGMGISAGTISTVNDSHNGTYTATFTGTTAGTASSISASISGNPITSALPTVAVSPGAVSLAQSLLIVSSTAIVAGFTSTLTLTAKDNYSNTLNSGGLAVLFGTNGSGTSTGAISATTDHANGTYTAIFTGVTAGSAVMISAAIGGSSVTSSAPSIMVSTGTISPSRSTLSLSVTNYIAGGTAIATLVLKDASSNVVADSSQASNLSFSVLSSGTSSGSFSAITPVGGSAGTYQATFTASIAGTTNTLQAALAGSGNFSQTPSFTVQAGSMSPTISTSSPSLTSVTANGTSTAVVSVTLLDAYANPIAGKSVSLTTNRSGVDTISASSGPSNASGVVTFSVSSVSSGTSTYTARDTTDAVTVTATSAVNFFSGAANPALSTVAASLASVAANGTTTSTVTVTLLDANSNPVPGKTVILASSRGSNDTVSTASGVSSSLGVVSFTVKSIRSGASVYTATDTSDSVTVTATASVNYLVGPLSQASSTLTASPSSVADDGVATTTLSATLMDAYLNPISGKTVALTSNRNSGSTVDIVSAASGSSSSSGIVTFTVSSTLAGAAIFTAIDSTDSLTITQTASVSFTLGGQNSIAFTTGPVTPVNADSTQTLRVAELDASQNIITTDSSSSAGLTAYSSTNCTGVAVTGALSTTSVTLANGVATFSSLQVKKIAVKSLLATINSKTACALINVNPGAMTALSFTTSPTSTTTDTSQTLALTEADANGNTVTTDSSSTISLAPYASVNCSGTALALSALSSAATTAVSGVGSFSGFRFLKTNIQSVLATSGARTTCASNLTISPGAAVNITANSGDGQTGNAGSALALPLVALATDANLNAVPGTILNWAITVGGGTLSACTTTTNSLGQAQCTYTLAIASAGSRSVTATLNGTSTLVTFTATSTSSPFAYKWNTISSSASSFTVASTIDFTSNACELTPASQTDSGNSVNSFASGTFNGITFNTLTDGISTGLKLGTGGNCNGQTQNCVELNSSWTPQWGAMVAYWKLNEVAGSSGSNSVSDNVGTNTGTPNAVSFGDNGKLNSAASFDGTSSYIDIGNPSSLQFSGIISLSTWVNVKAFPSAGGIAQIVGRIYDGTSDPFFLRVRNTSGTHFLDFGSYTGGSNYVTSGILNWNVGTWHHVIGVFDGSYWKLYTDGVLLSNDPFTTGVIAASSSIRIGTNNGAGLSRYFNGSIDDMAIWSVALTATEAKVIYDHQSTGIIGGFGGNFTSRIIDGFGLSPSWTSLSWLTTLPFGKAMPDAVSGTPQSESSSSYTSLSTSTLMNGNIGLWHLDEPAGTSGGGAVIDSSGQGSNGTPSGGVTFGVTGKISKAANFNGTNASILLNGLSLPWGDPNWSGSVSFWAKGSGIALGNSRQGNNINFGWVQIASGSSGFAFVDADINGAPYIDTINSSAVIDTTVWNHYVVTSDGASHYKLSVNGAITYVTHAFNPGASTYNTVNIGLFHNYTYSDGYFTGSVDEVAVWNRPISPSEIQQLYQRGASRIKFQARSCLAADCSNVTDIWKGPDGSENTYFSELNNTSIQSANPSGTVNVSSPTLTLQSYANPVTAKRYFQYRAIFESDSAMTALMPELKSVNIGPNHYDSSAPTVVSKTGVAYTSLSNWIATLGANGCAGGVLYNLGVGATSASATWYWWNGSAWVTAGSTTATANLAADIASNLASFATQVGTGTPIYFRAFLQSNGTSACELRSLELDGLQ